MRYVCYVAFAAAISLLICHAGDRLFADAAAWRLMAPAAAVFRHAMMPAAAAMATPPL